MTPNRWRQIEGLYEAARTCSPSDRADLLAQADPDIRLVVQQMLDQPSDGSPLDSPAWQETASLMQLEIGSQLGPYRIEAMIGAGGMGTVFRAVDTRLGRAVAVKISSERFSKRFEREARAISALNHAHICTLYDVGQNYLVMELVDGETLAARLKRGKIPLEQTIKFGMQIAGALTAAHAKGIIHRDLKPGNVMIAKDGVKLLDFGLARSLEDEAITRSNVVMGTPAYMAPEQEEGGSCDARTDIYALGLVLHEMATGKRATGGTPLNSGLLPERLAHVVGRCLRLDPDERWQSARDVSHELGWAGEATAPVGRSRSVSRLWPTVAGAALLALGVSVSAHFRGSGSEATVVRSTILPPEKTSFAFATNFGPLALSPDGRRMVFAATGEQGRSQLWIRPLDSPTAQPLQDTGGAMFPFWSPDSRWVAFFADGKLKKIDTRGGPPVALAEAPNGLGGSWSPKGMIVFSPQIFSPLLKIPANGGAAKPATVIGVDGVGFPWCLPDGEHFLFASWTGAGRMNVRVGSLNSTATSIIGESDSNAVYADGYLLYLRESSLMAQPFDLSALRSYGEALPVAEGVQRFRDLVVGGVFSVSAGGLLAYQAGTSALMRQLTWFTRTGEPIGTLGEPRAFFSIEFSPDQRILAASAPDSLGNYDLWMYDASRGLPTRFTSDPAGEFYGAWSPDGQSVIFNSTRKGHYDLYRKAINGASVEELLYADDTDKVPTSWSRDGRFLLYFTGGGLRHELWVLSLEPERPGAPLRPVPFRKTGFDELFGYFSPDGRWVLFESDESGRNEIYVAPFARPSEKRQISLSGGERPRWRKDGKEIFYVGIDRQMRAVEVKVNENTVELGWVRTLFSGMLSFTSGAFYEVRGDGQRILAAVPVDQKIVQPVTLVQNWTMALKK